MNRERNAFKAGLFIVVTIAAIIGVVMSIKGAGIVIEPMLQRQVRFALTDDLSGLRRGDDVRLGGFRVGLVKTIEVVSPGSGGAASDEPHIVVTFSLPARYQLHADSRVLVQSTLTGVTSLNIEHIGAGPEVSVVDGRPSAMSTFLAGLGDMTPDLRGITHDVRTQTVPKVNNAVDQATVLIRHVDSKVDPLADQVHEVGGKAGQALTEVRDVLGDSKTDIRGTMKNLNVATGKLPPLLDQVHGFIAKVEGTVDRAAGALDDVKQTIANTKDITGGARSLLVSNRGKLESMIASLKTTSDNLKGASVEIRRSPWRLLYKPEPSEMGNLNLYDSAREFAEGASNLSDAAAALRDAMHDPAADKQQIQKLVGKLDDSFSNFQTVENKLWGSVKN